MILFCSNAKMTRTNFFILYFLPCYYSKLIKKKSYQRQNFKEIPPVNELQYLLQFAKQSLSHLIPVSTHINHAFQEVLDHEVVGSGLQNSHMPLQYLPYKEVLPVLS